MQVQCKYYASTMQVQCKYNASTMQVLCKYYARTISDSPSKTAFSLYFVLEKIIKKLIIL